MTKNQHRKAQHRQATIEYWRMVDSTQGAILKERKRFLELIAVLKKAEDDVKGDLLSVDHNANFIWQELQKPPPRKYKKSFSTLPKRGLSKMTPREKIEKKAAVDAYWRNLENIDSVPATEMIKSAKTAKKSKDDIQRDLQTLRRINKR